MTTSLLIICESSGTAVPLARSDDHDLLIMAAEQAVGAKQIQAKRAMQINPVLGRIAMNEAAELESRLLSFIPGMRSRPHCSAR